MTSAGRKVWAVALAVLLAAGTALLVPAQQPPPPSEQKQGPIQPKPPEQEAPYALQVEVPLVNVDVTVATPNGDIVNGLQREHFRVFADGQEQQIVAFAPSEAPLTTVLLVEASPALGYLLWNNLDTAYLFLNQLRKGDWVAMVAYDLKPRLEVDFTQDRNEIIRALQGMQYGMARFSEVALYDALADTLDRLKDVDGKKSIIIICAGKPPDSFDSGGINTFGKLTWDDVRKITREERATIFAINLSWAIERGLDRQEAYGRQVGADRLQLRIDEAQLRDLTEQTGGRLYMVRFIGEIPGIYNAIGAVLRSQYSLAFRPKNFKRDGKFHKIEVKLVAPDGQPLEVRDQNNKKVKYEIYARKGYYAPEA